MKILVSYRAAPRIRSWETGAMVAAAFRRLGHDVDEYARMYETDKWLCHDADGNEVMRRMTDIDDCSYTPAMVHDHQYGLVLNMECNDPDPQYFELTKVKTKKRAVCHYDTSYYPAQALSNIARYKPNHVFFANSGFRQYGVTNASWLPYAADPRMLRDLDYPKTIDVALVGSDRPARRKLIETMRSDGIKAELISGVFKEDYIDALASCRIVVNENPPEGAGLLNMRSFEVPAAGAMLLTGDPEIGEVFITAIHAMQYNDPQHACAQAGVFLDNPGTRIGMAERAQKVLQESHMYDHRAQEILDVMGF